MSTPPALIADFDLATIHGTFLNALGLIVLFAAYCVITLVVVDIAKATYTHYSKGNHIHPEPLALGPALLVGTLEVCVDRPMAFHRRRMDVVRKMEADRADAIADAMLRHPSNFRARQAAMSAHPSAARHPAHLTVIGGGGVA